MERKHFAYAAAAVLGVVALIVLFGNMGYNRDDQWQIHQSVTGKITVIDRGGYYLNMFGTVTDYPRYRDSFYSAHHKEGGEEDDSIRCTFNDGGTAKVSVYVRFSTPPEEDQRRAFHRVYSANIDNTSQAVRAHLVNCVKAAAPLMSASENQASRKAEFAQVIQNMMQDGLYVMRQTRVTLEDQALIEVEANADGKAPVLREKPTEVMATEIVRDTETGKPLIAEASPLTKYGIGVEQFSVTDIDYDPETLKQFAAKKESFLLAEQAKAQRQQFVQEKLKIIAEGESEVARIEQEGNKEKMAATVSAEKEAAVAIINKDKAVTEATQKVEVAQQEKLEADTRFEIAEVQVKIAEEDKKAEIAVAEAKQKALEIGGALSEEERVLAEIAAERDAKVATALAGLKVPGVVIVGGKGSDSGGGGENLQSNLINLTLLRALGIIPKDATKPVE